MNRIGMCAGFIASLGLLMAPIAYGQDYSTDFTTDPSFSSVDNYEYELGNRVDARVALRLRIPFGGPAKTYEANKPRLSLNMGIAQSRDWQTFGYTQNYSNVLEFGTTFDGHDYLNIGQQQFDYQAILAAQDDAAGNNGNKNKAARRVGLAVVAVGGLVAAGLVAGLIVIATDDDFE